MKILLVGNHTCGNRGDGAILRGLLHSIKRSGENVSIDIISRYPFSSSYLLGEDIKQDPLFIRNPPGGLLNKLKNKVLSKTQSKILMSKVEGKGLYKSFKLPNRYMEFIENLKDYDAIIQVGGSFFVDLYGVQQFDHILCSLLANKKIYLVGHSVGPFKDKTFNNVANYCFSKVEKLILRESVSLDIMKRDNVSCKNIEMGVDTAFLVDSSKKTDNYMTQHWSDVIKHKPTVAITMRRLAPFDKRLGVTQDEYETAMSKVISHVNNKGFQVLAVSTCTGIESYNNDDRMVCLSVKNKLSDPSNYHVVIDELNDLELGDLLSKCDITIGTRLHSAIISMTFGTPAIAINYEHKSLGIMNSLDLGEYSMQLSDLLDGTLIKQFDNMTNNLDDVKKKVSEKVKDVNLSGDLLIKNLMKQGS